MSKINFFIKGNPPKIKFSKATFRSVATTIFQDHSKTLDYVNIIFCDDEYILEVNKTHLDHDFYTDIITFDYDEDEVQSDIYISTERVLDNACKEKTDPSNELYRVMIHGCVHLCGLGDKTVKEVKVMRGKEDDYLGEVVRLGSDNVRR